MIGMVICLASMKCLDDGNGKKVLMDRKVIETFDNYHDFGFDIYQPDNWKPYLKKYRKDGKLLPRKDNVGNRIVYHVYFFGIPKGFPRHDYRGSYYNLFPGYNSDGTKRYLKNHGFIDD